MRQILPLALACVLVAGACASAAPPADSALSTSTTDFASTSTTAVASGPPTTGPDDERPDPCAGLVLGPPVAVAGHDEPLTEISGAVLATEAAAGLSVWVHQDSGQPPELYRIGLDGRVIDVVSIRGVEPYDWEDIAAAVDEQGERHLFVADIGDNRRERTQVEVHRLIEPVFGSGEVMAEAIVLSLPHGARDAEALVVDQRRRSIVLLTKSVTGSSEILVGADAAWVPAGTTVEMEAAGVVDLGIGQAVLAADLTPDGSLLAVRTPGRVLMWRLDPGRSVADALVSKPPCRAPAPFDIFGEALALIPDGYVLVGEAAEPSLRLAAPEGR